MTAPYDPDRHHRRSIRLKGYDYSSAGAYFVTVCIERRLCLLGHINDGILNLSSVGELVRSCWLRLPDIFPGLALDAFVVMPNHFHGIFVIAEHPEMFSGPQSNQRATPRVAPTARKVDSVGSIVGTFKSMSTRRVNQERGTPSARFWQRNYWERILRDERELDEKRTYIAENPLKWELDSENPNRKRSGRGRVSPLDRRVEAAR